MYKTMNIWICVITLINWLLEKAYFLLRKKTSLGLLIKSYGKSNSNHRC